jgi:cytochrome b
VGPSLSPDRLPGVTVWPWWQRLLHWGLALSVLAALLTHESGKIHEWLGYAALGLACLRTVLGFIGPEVARFATFTRGARDTLDYARAALKKQEDRYLNHNPLGAWMVVTLLALTVLGGLMGWLYTTDRFWGIAWVGNLHALLTWPFVLLIAVHLIGVIHAGLRHRENLVASMIHGRKRPVSKE